MNSSLNYFDLNKCFFFRTFRQFTDNFSRKRCIFGVVVRNNIVGDVTVVVVCHILLSLVHDLVGDTCRCLSQCALRQKQSVEERTSRRRRGILQWLVRATAQAQLYIDVRNTIQVPPHLAAASQTVTGFMIASSCVDDFNRKCSALNKRCSAFTV